MSRLFAVCVILVVIGAGVAGGRVLSRKQPSPVPPLRGSVEQTGVVVLSDTIPICGSCELRLSQIEVLASANDTLLLPDIPSSVSDASGNVIMFSRDRASPILRFVSGRPAPIGRIGAGPGEYRSVHGVARWLGDTIAVMHDGVIISLFSNDNDFVRSFRTTVRLSGQAVALHSGVIVAGATQGSSRRPIPYHRISFEGKQIGSTGSPGIVQRHGIPLRVLRYGDQGRLWASEPNNYRLEMLDSTGQALRTFVVAVPEESGTVTVRDERHLDSLVRHRPKYEQPHPGAAPLKHLEVPPIVEIAGIEEAPGGRLIVALHVPAQEWRTVPLEYIPRGHGRTLTDATRTRVYRTIIDVIDLTSNRLVMRFDVDEYGELIRHDRLILYSVSENGVIGASHYEVVFSADSAAPVREAAQAGAK